METEFNLKEKLADLEHYQWATWAEYMIDNWTKENIEKWKRQLRTPYEDLSEKEKNSDREWADKVLKIFNEWKEQFIKEILDELERECWINLTGNRVLDWEDVEKIIKQKIRR
ncbi:MAG: hypothetical protein ACTSQG_09710 [Promethearchaeota archaeon]